MQVSSTVATREKTRYGLGEVINGLNQVGLISQYSFLSNLTIRVYEVLPEYQSQSVKFIQDKLVSRWKSGAGGFHPRSFLRRKIKSKRTKIFRSLSNIIKNSTKYYSKILFSTGKGNGFTRPYTLSPDLAALMGAEALPRHEVVKKVWAIIKERNLYDPKNKQFAICDPELHKVMGVKRFRTFGMLKFLKPHFLD